MIKFWGILPYLVNYTTDGLNANEGGHVKGLTITINPAFKDDAGLFNHELEHIKQVYKTVGLHSWLYHKYKTYKLTSECEAFIAGQLKYKTKTYDEVVNHLYNDYDLGFSKEQIAEKLNNRMKG